MNFKAVISLLALVAVVTTGTYKWFSGETTSTSSEPSSAPSSLASLPPSSEPLLPRVTWETYKQQYQLYIDSSFEARYKATFEDNLERFQRWNEEHQDESSSSQMGITPHAHLTTEEFKAWYSLDSQAKWLTDAPRTPGPEPGARQWTSPVTLATSLRTRSSSTLMRTEALPNNFDWRTQTLKPVHPIQNQGQCGSCYAFGVTNAIRVANVMKTQSSSIPVLSAQQILDCDLTNMGCAGGYSAASADHAIAAGGLVTNASYPYVSGGNGGVTNNCSDMTGMTKYTGSYRYGITTLDPEAMRNAIYNWGPITIQLACSQPVFQNYVSGIITDYTGCGYTIDHNIQLIGWGSSGSTKYWIGKNQWGTSWGEAGYVRLKRETTSGGQGICGCQTFSYGVYLA